MLKSALASLVLLAAATGDSAAQNARTPETGRQVVLKYMGAAGWEISDGTTVILIDPYLSRINGPQPPGNPYPLTFGDTRPLYAWDDIAVRTQSRSTHTSSERTSSSLLTRITTTIWMFRISRSRRATDGWTESTENGMRAFRVPEGQLITGRGGEDYEFGVFSQRVIPSIHSALDHKHYFGPNGTSGYESSFDAQATASRGRDACIFDPLSRSSDSRVRRDELHRARDRRFATGCRSSWCRGVSARDPRLHWSPRYVLGFSER